MSTLHIEDFYTTTVSAGITSGDTSVVVATPPSSYPCYIVINGSDSTLREICKVTGISSNTLTITRGIGVTSAHDHATGAAVKMAPVANMFLDIDDELTNTTTGHKHDGSDSAMLDDGSIKLANDGYLLGRNAADDADINIVKVDTGNDLQLGAAPILLNNTALKSLNASGSAKITLMKLNTSNIIEIGTEIYIDQAGNKTGIGSSASSPDCTLHIAPGSAGTVDADSDAILAVEYSDDAMINILTPADKIGYLGFGDPDDSFIGGISYDHTDNSLDIITNDTVIATFTDSDVTYGNFNIVVGDGDITVNTDSFFVDSTNKRIGIGTATPAYAIDILEDDTGDDAVIQITKYESDEHTQIIGRRADGTVASPTAVSDALCLSAWHGQGYDGDSFEGSAYIGFFVDGTVSDGVVPGQIRFFTADSTGIMTRRMSINADGSVYIGDSASTDNTHGLTINMADKDNEIITLKSSDVSHGMTSATEDDTFSFMDKRGNTTGGVRLFGFSSGTQGMQLVGVHITENTTKSTSAAGAVEISARTNDGTGTQDLQTTDSNILTIANYNTVRYIFDKEGTAHADVAWTTFSDGRFKESVEEIPYGLDEVLKMKPSIYNKYSGSLEDGKPVYADDKYKRQVGFVAQELMEIVPELVNEPNDPDTSLYSVNYDKVCSVLVKAVQELYTMIK